MPENMSEAQIKAMFLKNFSVGLLAGLKRKNIVSLSLRQTVLVHQSIVKAFEVYNDYFESPSLMDQLVEIDQPDGTSAVVNDIFAIWLNSNFAYKDKRGNFLFCLSIGDANDLLFTEIVGSAEVFDQVTDILVTSLRAGGKQ
jgi:hypothetical protein